MPSSGAMPARFPEPTSAWHDQRVLVTGASGFIGARLTARLSALGARVTAVRSGRGKRQPDAGPATRWREVDLLDAAAVQALIIQEQPAVVFHLAGVVNLERTPEVARACLTVNVLGTHNLLDALRAHPVARLLYASTTEIYGNNTPPFREDQVPQPPSPYAVSKLAWEHLCRVAWQADGVAVVSVRRASVYGPGQAPHRATSSSIRAGLTGEWTDIWHAEQRRDWLYLEDAIEGLLVLARCDQAIGQMVNLGSTTLISQRELVELVGRLLGVEMPVHLHQQPRRAAEAPVWSTDGSRAREWCGWQPRYTFEQGLQETIRWHQAQLNLQQHAVR